MISRTALVTAAAATAVVLAGSFAMGANLGVFDSPNDAAAVGQLDLADAQAAPTATGPGDAGSGEIASWSTQDYDVDGAGIVSLRWQDGAIEVARAQPADGWSATVQPSGSAEAATVDFTDADGTVHRFGAQLHADGSVQAAVVTLPPAAAAGGGSSEGGEREGDEHEGDEHESGEHEAEEHEYEGGEDDD
jgi:hypothetical protein